MNRQIFTRIVVSSFMAATLMLALGSCGTRQGNGLVSVEFEALGTVAWYDVLLPRAWAADSEVTMCFKRLRLKKANGDALSDAGKPTDFTFEVGEITLAAGGTKLGDVAIPAGNYRRIELELDDVCGSGASISVTSGSTTTTTDAHIVLKFDGEFVSEEVEQRLALKVDAIVNAVETATNPGQIKVLAEGNAGSF